MLPIHGGKLPKSAYDVHKFYTLYGSFHEIINLHNEIPPRAWEIINPYLGDDGTFIYDADMDFIPRYCPVPGGEMDFIDAFYEILYRAAGDPSITHIDANTDITDLMSEEEKEIFGDVIPTLSMRMYRQKTGN